MTIQYPPSTPGDPEDKFIPKLYYVLLVSHRTTIEGDFSDPIPVPESVKQVSITVHTFNGDKPDANQVWRELNSRGYYSYQYSLQSYWQPSQEDPQPF